MLIGIAAAMPVASQAASRTGDGTVTVDFSTHGFGTFDPLFYRQEGIEFPAQRCGSAGCDSWFVGFIQGDDALVGNSLLGPIAATFLRPVVDLSLRVAPAAQGTAIYTLIGHGRRGQVVAAQSLTITQDTGDPENGPAGYITIALDAVKPIRRFTLDSAFVRSSFGTSNIEYGLSSITYRR